jgi:hypothetical protein
MACFTGTSILTAPGHLPKQIKETKTWRAEEWKSFSLYKCLWRINEGQKKMAWERDEEGMHKHQSSAIDTTVPCRDPKEYVV